jgi:hypothetical protein
VIATEQLWIQLVQRHVHRGAARIEACR